MLFHPAYLDVAERAGRIQKALRDGSLSERDTAFLAEAYAYRYKEGVLGLGHTGAAEPASEGEFEDPYTLSFVITRLQEDRDGDVVLPLGCRLGNFEKSPVWFFGHQEWAVPIGTARNKRHDRLYVWPQEDLIRAACRFDEEDPDAMFIHGKVKRGFLNATSMSFVPIEAYKRDTVHEKAVPHEGRSQRPLGWLFKAYDLTEISIVGVGSNAGAIRDALDQEKSFISPRLQKGMMAYAAQAKGCWNGWCPCPPCGKGFGQTPSAERVSNFAPGDTVFARTGLTWINPDTGKTERFAKPGERMTVVRVTNIGRMECRRANGDVATYSSVEVRRKSVAKEGSCGCNDCKAGKACGCSKGKEKGQPSEEVSSDKACQILRDGEANGKPLTEDQRGMFGAACGRGKKQAPTGRKDFDPVLSGIKTNLLAELGVRGMGIDEIRSRASRWPAAKVAEALRQLHADGLVKIRADHDSGKAIYYRSLPSGYCEQPGGVKPWPKGRKGGRPVKPVSKGERRTLTFNGYAWADKLRDGVGKVTTINYQGQSLRVRIMDVKHGKYLQSQPGGGKIPMPQSEIFVEVLPPKETKQLEESSGMAGGYTVPAGGGTQDPEMPGWSQCTTCDGSGNCPDCDGSGEDEDGNDCEGCGGSGECPDCVGVGMVEKGSKRKGRRHMSEQRKQADDEEEPEGRKPREDEEEEPKEEPVEQKEEPAEGRSTVTDPADAKASALTNAHLYSHLKAADNYLEEELPRMDNPGMQEHLQKLKDEHLPNALEHLRQGMEQHHPDHDIEGLAKGLEQQAGSGNMEMGEENKVASGEVPPETLEDDEDLLPPEEEVPPEEDVVSPEPGTEDEDEILERYRTPKGWKTKVVGRVRRTKDGRAYLVRKASAEYESVGFQLAQMTQTGSRVVAGRSVRYDRDRDEFTVDGRQMGLKEAQDYLFSKVQGQKATSKDLQQAGTHDRGEEDEDERYKALTEAGEYLKELGEDAEVPKRHKAPLRHHAKRLGEVAKGLSNAGKVQRNGGPGSPLTDEGTAGNKGSMKEEGERQGKNPAKGVSKAVESRVNGLARRFNQLTGIRVDGE